MEKTQAAPRPRGSTATSSATDEVLAQIATLREHAKDERKTVALLRERVAKERALLAEEEKEKDGTEGNCATDSKQGSSGRMKKGLRSASEDAFDESEEHNVLSNGRRDDEDKGDPELFALLRQFEDLEADEEDVVRSWSQNVIRCEDATEARPYLHFTLTTSAIAQALSPRTDDDASSQRSALLSELFTLERQMGDESDEIFADRANFERHRRLLEAELRERLALVPGELDRRDLVDSKESPASSTASTSTGGTGADKAQSRWGDFRASAMGDKVQALRRQHTFLGSNRKTSTPKKAPPIRAKQRERSRSADLGVIVAQRLKRENTLAEEWEPPSLHDDPVTFPLSLVRRYTLKRRGDTRSLRYDDNGDLTRGSTRDLFLHLVSGKEPEFSRHFLLGANYFLDPVTLLQLFVLFYRAPSAKNDKANTKIRVSILDHLEQWISTQFATLKGSKKWVDLFERFLEYLKRGKEPDAIAHGDRLQRYWQGIKLSKLIDVPKIKTPKDEMPPANMVFTDIDPSDLARQLTLREQQYFHSIPLSEYYKLAWTKHNARALAPNLLKIIARFNAVSFWVATTITAKIGVTEEDDLSPKERAQLLSYWIRVLDKLVTMHNYNSALQIYSALNMTPIERLKATWAAVPRSDLSHFEAFAAKLQSNFKGYRDDLELIMLPDGTVERPCIPMHSLVLRDLSMVEEMDDFGADGAVNWSKIALLSSAFHTIQGFRSKKYTFSEDKAIQALLWHASAISDDALYERAAEISAAHSKFKWKANSTKIQVRKGSSANLMAPQAPSSKTSFSLSSSAESEGHSVQHTTSSPALSLQPIVRRESLVNMRSNMKRPRASSDGGEGRMLSASTPPPASPKMAKASSKPLKSPKSESTGERKRSRSIREVLFGGHKKSDDASHNLPLKFVDVSAGSEVHANFKLYLEKRYVAEHLEVYAMIEKVEGGSEWSPEEVRLACEGLCSKYLGTGDDPELIPVDEMLLESIKERLANPTVTMFKELKRAVAQTLEEHYGNFIESGGVASDLRSNKSSQSRKDSKESPRGKSKAVNVSDKGRSQSKLAMHISSSSSKRSSSERLDPDEQSPGKKY